MQWEYKHCLGANGLLCCNTFSSTVEKWDMTYVVEICTETSKIVIYFVESTTQMSIVGDMLNVFPTLPKNEHKCT